jgi:ribose-phosphate pyrophosphokinase
MTKRLFFALPGNEVMAERLAAFVGADLGRLETRSFPDGETYLRFATDPRHRSVVLVCTLDRPDMKFLRLAFAGGAARALGARKVGLVAPYLAYMRQDTSFRPGEAVTSVTFAKLLSAGIDWLVTVDPHLHRYKDLDAIYPISTRVAHSAPLLSSWIKSHVPRPFVIGPDIESEQWVSAVAQMADAPYRVLRKERRGDRDVAIAVPDLTSFANCTPVLVDDIVSTARTMIETSRLVRQQHLPAPVCIAVHGLFSYESYNRLKEVSSRVVTTNSVPHTSSEIDLLPVLAQSLETLV